MRETFSGRWANHIHSPPLKSCSRFADVAGLPLPTALSGERCNLSLSRVRRLRA